MTSDGSQLQGVQRRRKRAFVLGLALWIVLLFTESRRVSAPGLHVDLGAGLVLILVCIMRKPGARSTSAGSRSDSSSRSVPLVTRNPLYALPSSARRASARKPAAF
jgi:hypothetical protein